MVDAVDDFHQEALTYVVTEFANRPDLRDDHLRAYAVAALRILSNIHEQHLPFLEAASNQSAFLLLPLLRRGLRLVGTEKARIDLTLVPRFEYVYGFTGMKDLATKEIGKLPFISAQCKEKYLSKARDLPKWTAFISYPQMDQGSALSLTVLAHELAHLVDFITEAYKTFLPIKLDSQSFEMLVRLSQPADEDGTKQINLPLRTADELEYECYQQCISVVQAWLQEIVADIFAVRAIGPAYMFSFMEFLARSGMENSYDQEHPAPATRLKFLIDELEDLGYFSTKNNLLAELTRIRSRVIEEASATKYQYAALVADRTIQNSVNRILPAVRAKLGNYSYSAKKYVSEVEGLVSKLAAGISPIESRPCGRELFPNSAVAILNAGWELHIARLNDFRKLFVAGTTDPVLFENLNNLILKAIESSELMRQWKESSR